MISFFYSFFLFVICCFIYYRYLVVMIPVIICMSLYCIDIVYYSVMMIYLCKLGHANPSCHLEWISEVFFNLKISRPKSIFVTFSSFALNSYTCRYTFFCKFALHSGSTYFPVFYSMRVLTPWDVGIAIADLDLWFFLNQLI